MYCTRMYRNYDYMVRDEDGTTIAPNTKKETITTNKILMVKIKNFVVSIQKNLALCT